MHRQSMYFTPHVRNPESSPYNIFDSYECLRMIKISIHFDVLGHFNNIFLYQWARIAFHTKDNGLSSASIN